MAVLLDVAKVVVVVYAVVVERLSAVLREVAKVVVVVYAVVVPKVVVVDFSFVWLYLQFQV